MCAVWLGEVRAREIVKDKKFKMSFRGVWVGVMYHKGQLNGSDPLKKGDSE